MTSATEFLIQTVDGGPSEWRPVAVCHTIEQVRVVASALNQGTTTVSEIPIGQKIDRENVQVVPDSLVWGRDQKPSRGPKMRQTYRWNVKAESTVAVEVTGDTMDQAIANYREMRPNRTITNAAMVGAIWVSE